MPKPLQQSDFHSLLSGDNVKLTKSHVLASLILELLGVHGAIGADVPADAVAEALDGGEGHLAPLLVGLADHEHLRGILADGLEVHGLQAIIIAAGIWTTNLGVGGVANGVGVWLAVELAVGLLRHVVVGDRGVVGHHGTLGVDGTVVAAGITGSSTTQHDGNSGGDTTTASAAGDGHHHGALVVVAGDVAAVHVAGHGLAAGNADGLHGNGGDAVVEGARGTVGDLCEGKC